MARPWALALVVCSTVLTGCLGGGDAPAPADEYDTGGPDAPRTANTSANATYLENLDYSREHIHDYWNGADERVLLETTLETNTPSSLATTLFWPFIDGEPRTGVGTLLFTLPNATFVPEGTGELVVEVDATGALKNGEIALAHRAANAASFVELEPQGAEASWTIELTPEMADLPHATSTRWTWRLEAEGPGAVLDGALSVKVTAHRLFDIEAWPEHDDHWDAGRVTKLDLGNTSGTYDHLDQHLIVPEGAPFPVITLPDGTIVPPETSALVVTLRFERNDEDPKNLLNGPVLLIVKPGSTAAQYEVMHGNKIEESNHHLVYALPVDQRSVDSPYATTSGWAFRLHAPIGYHDQQRTIDIGGGDVGSGSFDVGVVAYRVVPPWLDEVLKDKICRSC